MPDRDHRAALIREAAVVVAGFTLVTLVVTWPLMLRAGSALPGDLRDPLLNTWILAWDADRLRHLLRGLWDAPVFYPERNTLAYSEHLLGIAVLVAPVQWVTGNPVLTYNCAFVLSYVITGSGMYLLARSLTGRRDAAALAGLIYAFNPYRTLQVTLLQVLMAGWMPIASWALHRYFAAPRLWTVAAFVAAFLMQGLSNTYFLVLQVIPLAMIGAAEIARARPRGLRAFVHAALAVIVIGLVLAPVAAAYRRVGIHATQESAAGPSLDVSAYYRAGPSNLAWGRWPYRPRVLKGRPAAQSMLFPGLSAIVLAALGVAAAVTDRVRVPRARWVVGLYGSIAIVAALLSLGPAPTFWGHPWPVGGLFRMLSEFLPGFGAIRAPARLANIVLLGISIVAAVGAAWLLPLLSGRRRGMVTCSLAALIVIEGVPELTMPSFDPNGTGDERNVYAWLRASPPGAVIELPMQRAGLADYSRVYVYHSLQHGHPLVNGQGRLRSPLDRFLSDRGSPLLDRRELDQVAPALRAIGVRYIILRQTNYLDRALAAATYQALMDDYTNVVEWRTHPSIHVFALHTPAAEPATDEGTPLRPDRIVGLTASASSNPSQAVDADLDTAWRAGRRQTGAEYLEMQLDTSRDVSRLQLELPQRLSYQFPRSIRVESWDDQDVHAVLYQGIMLPVVFKGLVDGRPGTVMRVDLPANRTHRLRITQTARSAHPWAIAELSLWERR